LRCTKSTTTLQDSSSHGGVPCSGKQFGFDPGLVARQNCQSRLHSSVSAIANDEAHGLQGATKLEPTNVHEQDLT